MIYTFNGRTPVIGQNTFISPTASVIGSVILGDNCYVAPGVSIRCDTGSIVIGSRNEIEDNVVIHNKPYENIVIGDDNVFGHSCVIHSHSFGSRNKVGMLACVSINTVIEDECIIAEGAVVPNRMHVSSRSLMAGVPAKRIRDITDEELKTILYGSTEFSPWVIEQSFKDIDP